MSGLGLLAGLLAAGPAAQAQGSAGTPTGATVVVIGSAPLPGSSVEADKLPGEVRTLSVPELSRDRRIEVLPALIAGRMAGVSLNDEQGSRFQPDLSYHGFEASPISGVAEGLAVYQDGMRLNEAFGDNVNWDLVPQFAVRSVSVQSDNPVFGLNALGGAVTLNMKDGLTFNGLDGELSGGSFGDVGGHVEYGAHLGPFGLFLAVGGLHDDGFRYQSPTTLRQAYGDLAYDRDRLSLHLSVSAALNDIAAAGPAPVELLARDPRAVFTYPQAMQNGMQAMNLRAVYRANAALSISGDLYYRHFRQTLTDGNTTDVTTCGNDPGQFCLEGQGDYPGDALYDSRGDQVAADALPPGATPGEIDFTHTDSTGLGAAVQASLSAPIGARANSLVLGAAVDSGETLYGAYGELGALQPGLRVVGSGLVIDQGLSPTAQPPIESPVGVDGRNLYGGLYAIDVLDLTPRLSWTLSGRLNLARISLRDRMGGALGGAHSFSRFNPGGGVSYRFSPAISGYAGYSESNRAPTAGELSCADPSSPCLLDAFLVSDPNLKQVVSHTYEAGLRGAFKAAALPGSFAWDVGLYRTDVDDDILLLATPVNGFGYFQNAGATRRQGLDLHVDYRDDRLAFSASYAHLQAIFLNDETVTSNSPAANGDGQVHVRAGDRIPLEPADRLTLSADYAAAPGWSLGADLRLQAAQYLAGDESNQERRLPGFALVNLRTSYRLGPHLDVFAEIRNLFGHRYYTYGTFVELDGLPPDFTLSNPRSYSPSEGQAVAIGAHVRLF